MSYVFIVGKLTGGGLTDIEVTAIDSSLSETPCTTIAWDTGLGQEEGSSDCGLANALTIRVTFVTVASALPLGDFYKFVVLGAEQPDPVVTITGDTFDDNAVYQFDLLTSISDSIALPVVTLSLPGCYPPTWKVYRVSDDADMEVERAGEITIVDPTLEINFDVSEDFSERLARYGTE